MSTVNHRKLYIMITLRIVCERNSSGKKFRTLAPAKVVEFYYLIIVKPTTLNSEIAIDYM